MMSLSDTNSDTNSDQFQPIAVNSLESFDKEHSNRTNKSKPDFDRFKALFVESEFKQSKAGFKALYDTISQKKEIVFKPLFDMGEDLNKSNEPEGSNISNESSDDLNILKESVDKELTEPEETKDEKGYRIGFEKGLEQGKEKGFEEGFKKGEKKGLEQGEQKGIEQGLQQGIEQGIEQGQKQGQEKGEAQVKDDATQILNSLEQSLKTADQTLDLLVDKYETNIISLIEQIVKKIIMARVEIDDKFVKPVIIDALKTLVHTENVILSVSEDDYEYIEMVKDEFFEKVDSLTSVSVKSDSSIKKGGCTIKTSTALISSDIESRLEVVFDAIKSAGAA